MADELKTSNERLQATQIADRLLDEPNCDPDDDVRVVCRQFMRSQEEITRLNVTIAALRIGDRKAIARYCVVDSELYAAQVEEIERLRAAFHETRETILHELDNVLDNDQVNAVLSVLDHIFPAASAIDQESGNG